MMKRMILIALLICPISSWATMTESTISYLQIDEIDQVVSVWLTGGISGSPACDQVSGAYLTFSMTRPLADHYLSLLASAHARQATVRVWGANDCIDNAAVETLLYFRLVN